MKRLLTLILLATALLCHAENATSIFNKTVNAFSKAGTVSATYSMGSSRGTIVMSGNKFRILASDIKSWFNGKTQWTYAKQTGEVNITTPTQQELVMANPLSAANALQQGYNMTTVKGGIKLTPKKRSQVRSIVLYINRAYQLTGARYETTRGQVTTLRISNYKTHQNYPASTFVFSKNMVPRGTPVVDLR